MSIPLLAFQLVVTDPTWAELASKIPIDPPPEEITRGLHYVRSDELRHDLFYERIKGKGGVFVGVGTNQNYLMAAWAKPEKLVIIDFDMIVIHVHDAYRAFFLHAETPDEFLEYWKPKIAKRRIANGKINETFADQRKRALNARKALKQFGARVYYALKEMRDEMKKHGRESFMSDQAQFDTLKTLFAEERVLAIRGDFTGNRTMRGLADALAALDEEIDVLYVSNVEQYIGWSGKYRRNMLALPLADDSVVLRTYGWGQYRTADHNYRYYTMPGPLFHTWLETKKTRYVTDCLKKTEQPSGVKGYHELTQGPEGETVELAENK